MQADSHEINLQELDGGNPVTFNLRRMDNLALIWSIGIGIGYTFLVAFICWIGYRCFLVYLAYMNGDVPFIANELKIDMLISAAYFGIAIILRKKRIL